MAAPGSVSEPFPGGAVTIRLSDANETGLTSVTASILAPNMAAGDTVTGFIEVSNTGFLAQRYAVTTTGTSAALPANAAMAAALTAGVAARPSGTPCGATQDAAGQDAVVPAGTTLQTLSIGRRDLAAGTSERLCFYVTLPLSAGNASQGGAASFTLTFVAEQNNPLGP